jgi:hypothetical protein
MPFRLSPGEKLWHGRTGSRTKVSRRTMTNVNKIEVVTIIEGILIMALGAGIYFALPMLITGLLGAVFVITGMVVIVKGFFKKFRNP